MPRYAVNCDYTHPDGDGSVTTYVDMPVETRTEVIADRGGLIAFSLKRGIKTVTPKEVWLSGRKQPLKRMAAILK